MRSSRSYSLLPRIHTEFQLETYINAKNGTASITWTEALGNVPPAQKMGGTLPFKDWDDVLAQVKEDLVLPKGVYARPKAPKVPVIHPCATRQPFQPRRSGGQYTSKTSGSATVLSRPKVKGARVVKRTKGRRLQ